MPRYDKLERPSDGTRIDLDDDGRRKVPDDPLVPVLPGDGVGPELWEATRQVLEAAVAVAYKGRRRLAWWMVPGGSSAQAGYGKGVRLPQDTLQAINECGVALKGPLESPGAGSPAPNTVLRQTLDLYAGVRPIRSIAGAAGAGGHLTADLVLFQENTEDLYGGLEMAAGSEEARALISFLRETLGRDLRRDVGIAIKAISESGTRRLVRRAIRYALDHRRDHLTVVHQGDLMAATEGAFRNWAYALAKDEFPEATITEAEVQDRHHGRVPKGKVMVDDLLADEAFAELLLRPAHWSVVVTPNVLGDHLAQACGHRVGGIAPAPAANLGDRVAVFEPGHGPLPREVGTGRANPISFILAGRMLLEHLGWQKSVSALNRGLEAAQALQTGEGAGPTTAVVEAMVEGMQETTSST